MRRDGLHTFDSLYGKSFHFANEIVGINIQNGAHEISDTLGCKRHALKREVGRPTC